MRNCSIYVKLDAIHQILPPSLFEYLECAKACNIFEQAFIDIVKIKCKLLEDGLYHAAKLLMELTNENTIHPLANFFPIES